MIGLFCFVLAVLASPFKSKLRLEAENAVLPTEQRIRMRFGYVPQEHSVSDGFRCGTISRWVRLRIVTVKP